MSSDRAMITTTSDPFHMITTGGEGHFYWKKHPVSYWSNGTLVSDYNFNGQGQLLDQSK